MLPNHAVTWTPPPVGVIKINWDAMLCEVQDRLGISLVARDHEGGILATKKVSKAGCVVPLLAEVVRVFQAAIFASELHLASVILEGDSLQIVQGLNLHQERWDSVGLVLLDTRSLLSNLESW